MPLPYTREGLRDLLTPTKEIVTDAVMDRLKAEKAAGKKEVFLAEPVKPAVQDSTAMATAK